MWNCVVNGCNKSNSTRVTYSTLKSLDRETLLSVLKMGKHCSHLSLLLQILTFIFSLHSKGEMVIHITLFLHQWVNKYSSLTAKGVNEQRRLRALLEAHFNKSSFVFGLSCKRVEFELQFRARLINKPSFSSLILGSQKLASWLVYDAY